MTMFYTPYRYYKPIGGSALATYNRYNQPTKQPQAYSWGPTTTRVTSKRRRRGGRYQTFKKRLYDSTPAKHVLTSDNQTLVVGATHNTIYTCNLTANIVQGTGDNQRIGDSVELMSVKLNGLLSTNAAITTSCQYRIIVGWSGEEYNLPATFGAGLTSAELFQGATGAAWKNTGIINPKAFTVLDDRIVTLNNSLNLVSEIQEFAYTVPINSTFPYQAAGSVFGKTRSLYVVFIACTLNGVPGVTSAGSISLSTDMIFKQV